jgi:hypothetical protein
MQPYPKDGRKDKTKKAQAKSNHNLKEQEIRASILTEDSYLHELGLNTSIVGQNISVSMHFRLGKPSN